MPSSRLPKFSAFELPRPTAVCCAFYLLRRCWPGRPLVRNMLPSYHFEQIGVNSLRLLRVSTFGCAPSSDADQPAAQPTEAFPGIDVPFPKSCCETHFEMQRRSQV